MAVPWKFIKYQSSILVLTLTLTGCFQSDYTKLVKSELAKGVRMDSLVFGIKFGNSRDEFFGKCFDLNKQRLVTAGPNGTSVQYLFEDSLFHNQPTPVRMLFTPSFDKEDVIIEMTMEFTYPSWTAWDGQFQSDKLKEKVLKLLMNWYKGNEFVTAKINGDVVPVKLDGNRRMIVYPKNEQIVVVEIQDILHPKYRHSITTDTEKAK